jgi:hypothetical protein
VPRDVADPSIAADQDIFARALLWRDEAGPPSVCGPSSAPPQRRFTVYRNNVFASLTACLAARFPAVARLVGEEFFAVTSRVFIDQYPPASPALLEYGEEFAAFLQTFEPASGLPYLADVARLEWHVATAYHAADARPVGASALQRLGENSPDARIDLHPSCATLISRYPIYSIWHTNTHDEAVRPIDADSGGEAVLIVRPQFDVSVVRLDVTGTYAFIAALKAGHSLELAAEIGGEVDRRFDLAAALTQLFRCGAVAGVRRPRHIDRQLPIRNRSTELCAT